MMCMSNAITNRTMPPSTIIPILEYRDVDEAIRWLSTAFNFVERWRVDNHRAQISFEGGTIVIVPPQGEAPRLQSLLVRVKDIEDHCLNAKKKGVTIVQEPSDFPYGERQYTALDLDGHTWTFSQSINDVAPEAWGGRTHKLS